MKKIVPSMVIVCAIVLLSMGVISACKKHDHPAPASTGGAQGGAQGGGANPGGAKMPIIVPVGYNANDYKAIVSFLMQDSETPKISNGQAYMNKVGNHVKFNPNDPASWSGPMNAHGDANSISFGASPKVLRAINFRNCSMKGELNLKNCGMLQRVDVLGNSITLIDLTGSPALRTLECSENNLSSIKLSKNLKVNFVLTKDRQKNRKNVHVDYQ